MTDWLEKLKEEQKRLEALEAARSREAWEEKKAKAREPFAEAASMGLHGWESVVSWWMFAVARGTLRVKIDQDFEKHYAQAVDKVLGGGTDTNDFVLFYLRKYHKPVEPVQEYAAFVLMNWPEYDKYDLLLGMAASIIGTDTVLDWLKDSLPSQESTK